MKKASILLITLALFYIGCTDKTNQVELIRQIEGNECILVAVSARDVSWSPPAVGGSCLVIPFPPIPSRSTDLKIGCIKNRKDTIILEYIGTDFLQSEKALKRTLESIQLSFAPNTKQIWYKRDAIDNDSAGINRIIHIIDRQNIFYSNEQFTAAPNWAKTNDVNTYFEKEIADPTVEENLSYILWEIQSRKPVDDKKIRLAFSQWYLHRGAAWYIDLIKEKEFENPTFKSSMKLLVNEITTHVGAGDSISHYHGEILKQLFDLNTVSISYDNTKYNVTSLKMIAPVAVKYFFTNEDCRLITENIVASNKVDFTQYRKELFDKIQQEPNPERQVANAYLYEISNLNNFKTDFPFSRIYLKYYATDENAFTYLTTNLSSGYANYSQEEKVTIEQTLKRKVDHKTDSLSQELLQTIGTDKIK